MYDEQAYSSIFSRIFRVTHGYAYIATHTGCILERGGVRPVFFLNRKKCPYFEKKKALIVSIFGLNFPFKMLF